MRETRAYNVSIVIAMLSQFSAYIVTAYGIPDLWYKLNAITMAICFGLPLFARNVHKNEWSKILTMYAILLSSNQLLDEFFLDPTRLQWNEVFVGAFVFFHLLTKFYYAIRSWLQ